MLMLIFLLGIEISHIDITIRTWSCIVRFGLIRRFYWYILYNRFIIHSLEISSQKGKYTALLHRSFQIIPTDTLLKMANMMTLTY